MMNDKKARIVVPVHPRKDVKPGLIRAIKEAGLSRERFFELLKETDKSHKYLSILV